MRVRSHSSGRARRCEGFTLTELVVASGISVVFFTMAIGFFVSTFRYWGIVDQRMAAEQEANLILGRMIYGTSEMRGLRAANGYQVKNQGSGWTLTYGVGGDGGGNTNHFVYNRSAGTIVLNPGSHRVGRNVTSATVKAEGEGGVTIMVETEHQVGATKFRSDEFSPVRRVAETTVTRRNALHRESNW